MEAAYPRMIAFLPKGIAGIVVARGFSRGLPSVLIGLAGSVSRTDDFIEMGAELLRLNLAAPGQGLARDAGGEAEVVFDLRAGARLTAGRDRIHNQHIETLGGGINGRGEARGSRSGHHDQRPDPHCQPCPRRLRREHHGRLRVVVTGVEQALEVGPLEYRRHRHQRCQQCDRRR